MSTSASSLPLYARPLYADQDSGAGRYAPSPSGDLHLGNLRTAVLAWLMARSTGRAFHMRVEDLDRVREGAAQRQLDDLASLGIDWDQPTLYQSTRLEAYASAFEYLQQQGLVYECFCTRREIQEASSAPHGAPGAYPGTCRDLTEEQKEEKRAVRPPAYRLRANRSSYTVHDDFAGDYTGDVDDFVLLRNDGTYAYNLVSVVDDHAQGVDQVVRGDDLLPSAPRQAYLASLLNFEPVSYAHVPLALNSEGKRLAKRDGAVTLEQLREAGASTAQLLGWIADSIPLDIPADLRARGIESVADLLPFFSSDSIAQHPWVVTDQLGDFMDSL